MSYVSEQLEKLKAKMQTSLNLFRLLPKFLLHLSLFLNRTQSMRRMAFLRELQSLKELLCSEYLGLMTTARFR